MPVLSWNVHISAHFFYSASASIYLVLINIRSDEMIFTQLLITVFMTHSSGFEFTFHPPPSSKIWAIPCWAWNLEMIDEGDQLNWWMRMWCFSPNSKWPRARQVQIVAGSVPLTDIYAVFVSEPFPTNRKRRSSQANICPEQPTDILYISYEHISIWFRGIFCFVLFFLQEWKESSVSDEKALHHHDMTPCFINLAERKIHSLGNKIRIIDKHLL